MRTGPSHGTSRRTVCLCLASSRPRPARRAGSGYAITMNSALPGRIRPRLACRARTRIICLSSRLRTEGGGWWGTVVSTRICTTRTATFTGAALVAPALTSAATTAGARRLDMIIAQELLRARLMGTRRAARAATPAAPRTTRGHQVTAAKMAMQMPMSRGRGPGMEQMSGVGNGATRTQAASPGTTVEKTLALCTARRAQLALRGPVANAG